jgi:hypothetical protein
MARATWVILLLITLFVLLVLMFGALALPAVALRGSAWEHAAKSATMLVGIIYLMLLFFVVPQGLLLRALRVRSELAFALVGLVSGWFWLALFASGPILAKAAQARDIADALSLYLSTLTRNPASLVNTFWMAAWPWSLLGTGLLGALFGWLWKLWSEPQPTGSGREIGRSVWRWWPLD